MTDELDAEVAYRARWSLTWAAIAATAILLAWLIGTLAHQATRPPPPSTSTTQAAAANALEERIALHPSRGAARTAIVAPPPTSPPTSPPSSTPTTRPPRPTPTTRPPPRPTTSTTPPSSSSSLGLFRVTCYGPPQFPAGQHTATGRPVGPGSLAVDPRVIPLGTELVVDLPTGPVDVVADDTGGAIRGHHVDLWRASCSAWANPTVEIHKKNV